MMTATNPLDGLSVETAPAPTKPAAKPVSEKQESLIRKLVLEKDISQVVEFPELHFAVTDQGRFDQFISNLTGGWGGTASQLIDLLFQADYRQRVDSDDELDTTGLDGYFGFLGKRYVIDAPQKGKWAGWLFFKTGSDYHDQQRLGSVRPGGSYRGKAENVFNDIMADPQAAREEYARITGRCYACNRKLEDPTSVALGIGPVCRAS